MQYAKVLFISVTPTQLALGGRGHKSAHVLSQSIFYLIVLFFLLCFFILEAASFDLL